MPKLTPKQELFCLEYLKDLNATQAAIRAGYSEKTANEQASRLLANVNIQIKVSNLNQKRFEKVEDEGIKVVQELAKLAYSNVTDYLDIDEEGCTKVKPLSEMRNTGVIKSIKEKRIIKESPDGKDTILDNTFEFTMWDKNKALDNLGRHHGLFKDSLEIKGRLDGKSKEELDEIIKDLERKTQDGKTL